MQSDTDLILAIRDYIKYNYYVTAYDIIRYFNAKGHSEEKVLYTLRELIDLNELS